MNHLEEDIKDNIIITAKHIGEIKMILIKIHHIIKGTPQQTGKNQIVMKNI